jgi:uncharacterized protein (TIGR03118 family)
MRSWFSRLRQVIAGRAHRRPAPSCRPALETLEDRSLPSLLFHETDLVSDLRGRARSRDPHLVNAWGIAASPSGPFWIANNGTGTSTLYSGAGKAQPLVVTVPLPAGRTGSAAPTGEVFNDTSDFVVSAGGRSGPAIFLWATEDGTISGWNPNVNPTQAILKVDNSMGGPPNGAVYKGLALLHRSIGNFLLATNFRSGNLDIFGPHFEPIIALPGVLSDPLVPAGFAPFGIAVLKGNVVVTYAKQNAEKLNDVAGPGNGFVAIFAGTDGHLLVHIAAPQLNSPWGLAIAPPRFGKFGGALLVGNFGDGRINVFDPNTGTFRGRLRSDLGGPLVIKKLWGLSVGNGGQAGSPNKLFFTAGPKHEMHGLFGVIARG